MSKEIDSKICPKCLKESKGKKEIKKNHGLRKMGKKIVYQSYCRSCKYLNKISTKKLRSKIPSIDKIDLRTFGKTKPYKNIDNRRQISKAKKELENVRIN